MKSVLSAQHIICTERTGHAPALFRMRTHTCVRQPLSASLSCTTSTQIWWKSVASSTRCASSSATATPWRASRAASSRMPVTVRAPSCALGGGCSGLPPPWQHARERRAQVSNLQQPRSGPSGPAASSSSHAPDPSPRRSSPTPSLLSPRSPTPPAARRSSRRVIAHLNADGFPAAPPTPPYRRPASPRRISRIATQAPTRELT